MEKTITIDGKAVRLKATASFAVRYKQEFGTDVLLTITPFLNGIIKAITEKQKTEEAIQTVLENTEGFEIVDLYKIVYILAKTADKEIGDLNTWLDGFDTFPLNEVLPAVADVLIPSLFSTKEIKKKMTMSTKAS